MFPRPEKPFQLKITKDVTGMTEAQKNALQNVWRKNVKPDMELHSQSLFLLFFEQNPNYLQLFDFGQKPGSLNKSKSLLAHAMNVMNAVTAIIEFGLRDPPLFEFSLYKIVKNHQRRGIRRSDIRNMLASFKVYLMTMVEKDKVAFFEEAVDSLFFRITQGFDN